MAKIAWPRFRRSYNTRMGVLRCLMAVGWVVGTLQVGCGFAESRCYASERQVAPSGGCCTAEERGAPDKGESARPAAPEALGVCACEHLPRWTPAAVAKFAAPVPQTTGTASSEAWRGTTQPNEPRSAARLADYRPLGRGPPEPLPI